MLFAYVWLILFSNFFHDHRAGECSSQFKHCYSCDSAVVSGESSGVDLEHECFACLWQNVMECSLCAYQNNYCLAKINKTILKQNRKTFPRKTYSVYINDRAPPVQINLFFS